MTTRKLVLDIVAALLLVGCGGGDDPDSGDAYVTAKVDGVDYAGDSQGAALVRSSDSDSGELNLFPADALSGTITEWSAAETGTFALSSVDPVTAMLVYIDGQSRAHTSTSGTFTIDSWEWDDNVAPKLGYMSGTFAATCTTLDQSSTVEITDGAFYAVVTEVVRDR